MNLVRVSRDAEMVGAYDPTSAETTPDNAPVAIPLTPLFHMVSPTTPGVIVVGKTSINSRISHPEPEQTQTVTANNRAHAETCATSTGVGNSCSAPCRNSIKIACLMPNLQLPRTALARTRVDSPTPICDYGIGTHASITIQAAALKPLFEDTGSPTLGLNIGAQLAV
jgi:hypothetical protein